MKRYESTPWIVITTPADAHSLDVLRKVYNDQLINYLWEVRRDSSVIARGVGYTYVDAQEDAHAYLAKIWRAP